MKALIIIVLLGLVLVWAIIGAKPMVRVACFIIVLSAVALYLFVRELMKAQRDVE